MALYTVDTTGNVVPYVRPGDDALSARIRDAGITFAGTEYTQQRKALEQEPAAEGVDLFVAGFSALGSKKTGRRVSFCVWSLGVEELLPGRQ